MTEKTVSELVVIAEALCVERHWPFLPRIEIREIGEDEIEVRTAVQYRGSNVVIILKRDGSLVAAECAPR